jgi:uncharacterized membrane protein (DUF106 family)
MSFINSVLRGLFDLVVLPFRGMPAIVGLTVISVLVSAAILLAFARVSDQKALDQVKRRITAGVYEIRLFKDDLRTIFAAQLATFRHTLTYFRLSLTPMLWIMLPIVIVVIQLQFQYGYSSLEPGESTVLTVELSEEAAERVDQADGTNVVLEIPSGVRAETELAWAPSLRQAAWRVAGDEPGEHQLTVRIGDESFTKSLRVAGSTELRSPVRPSGLLGQIIYPAEGPLPGGSGVEAIRVDYEDAEISLLGWETHWLIVFFILTTVFAFALAKPLGVKI